MNNIIQLKKHSKILNNENIYKEVEWAIKIYGNNVDLSSWDVSNVTDISYLFFNL